MNTTHELDPMVSVATVERLVQDNARLRGDLLTVARRISHDLRTPLGGVISTSEILKEVLADQSPSTALLLAPILESAEGMGKLIDRVSFILKASATPAGREALAMGEVVFRVRTRLESAVLKQHATLAEPADWPEVIGVMAWLEVVWWNLLANALQYGQGQIELGWRKDDHEFRFWVNDRGDGVPVEKRAGLFKPFHLLHAAEAAPGLGLSIVQRLMELQGGSCGYEPRKDGGSCFYFTLPAGKQADARQVCGREDNNLLTSVGSPAAAEGY